MIHFTKLQGAGNDFVFIDRITYPEPIVHAELLARQLCDRHKGVGADGLILVERGEHAPFRMVILNSDGTRGGMCGNGVRCTARLLIENGHQPLSPFVLETETRDVEVEPLRVDLIRVNMGAPLFTRSDVGMMGSPDDTFLGQKIEALGESFVGTAVQVGNPHLVILTENVDKIELVRLGAALETHPLFPFKINVHFVQVMDKGHIKVRTWERGVGVTLACGSGTCGCAAVAHLQGGADRHIVASVPGGKLTIDYTDSGDLFMEGAAERVYEGVWLADLVLA